MGGSRADYDDNGWVLSLRSGTFLGDALAVLSEQVHERLLAGGDCDPGPASPESALFWGIVDLKFDPARPLTDRLKAPAHPAAAAACPPSRCVRLRGGVVLGAHACTCICASVVLAFSRARFS